MYAYTDACIVQRFVVDEIQASYSGYILDTENIMCLCTTLTIPYQNLLFGCFKGASELDVSIQQPEHILRDGSGIYICDITDFLLTVKAATLIFISGCGSALSSVWKGKQVLFIIW